MKGMVKPATVEAYIAAAPKAVQGKLMELRAVIRKVAPEAEERLSYGMPYFGYKGRLAYFRHWKYHIGLYIPTPVIEDHMHELKAYDVAKATVRFPLNKKLPRTLIAKLITARKKMNEARKGQ